MNGVNDSNLAVGIYPDKDGNVAAFQYDVAKLSLKAIRIPGAKSVFAQDISASGTVVGDFVDSEGPQSGVTYSSDGNYRVFKPDKGQKIAFAKIAPDGAVIGTLIDKDHAYPILMEGGDIRRIPTRLDFPWIYGISILDRLNYAVKSKPVLKAPGIPSIMIRQQPNDEQTTRPIAFPGSYATWTKDIKGDAAVGDYYLGDGSQSGYSEDHPLPFILSGDKFYTLSLDKDVYCSITGINRSHVVTGFKIVGGKYMGFVAKLTLNP